MVATISPIFGKHHKSTLKERVRFDEVLAPLYMYIFILNSRHWLAMLVCSLQSFGGSGGDADRLMWSLSLSLSLSLSCSRLGVQEVILVDCDVVSVSNVNRQVLYSTSDVGKRKVDAAASNLGLHNIRTSKGLLIFVWFTCV